MHPKQNIILLLACFVLLFNIHDGAAEQNKDEVVIPFRSDNGRIIIPLRLNNHETMLRFLFDTGANGMAIRKSLADSLQLSKGYEQQASFVGGNARITISIGNTVHLSDSVVLENQSIALFETIEETDGVIGLNLAQKYRISVDFDKQQITLSPHDKPAGEIPGEVVPVTYNKIIQIPLHLNLTGDKSIPGHFIFDTGANYHIIAFSRFVRKNRLLLSGFKPEEQSATSSMGVTTTVFSGKADRLEVTPNMIFTNIPITLQASSDRNDPDDVPDGSFGIQLINRYNFTLDLPDKKIYFLQR